MRRALLVLVIIGFVSLTIGIAIAFVHPLPRLSIRCTGYIGCPEEEPKSTESNSQTYVDARGYIPIVVGVGFLSTTFLYGIVGKKIGKLFF